MTPDFADLGFVRDMADLPNLSGAGSRQPDAFCWAFTIAQFTRLFEGGRFSRAILLAGLLSEYQHRATERR